MRFPTALMHSEQNDELCSNNGYNFFSSIPCAELYPKRAAAIYRPGSIKYNVNKQTAIEKIQDFNPPFRMWVDSLLNNNCIARSKDIMPLHSFKYCTITAINYNLENKVVSTKTNMFPYIAEEEKHCEN